MRLWRRTAWMSVLLVVAFSVLPMAPARADVPDWSGLDARFFAGLVPPQGTTVASVPLDPALSLTGAGPAYRVLYSTVNQHDQPCVLRVERLF